MTACSPALAVVLAVSFGSLGCAPGNKSSDNDEGRSDVHKIRCELIVGKWQRVHTEDSPISPTVEITEEFTNYGLYTFTAKDIINGIQVVKGTYKIIDDKLLLHDDPGRGIATSDRTITILDITSEKLVLEGPIGSGRPDRAVSERLK